MLCVFLSFFTNHLIRFIRYYNIYETAQEALRSSGASADSVHGSLLAIGQLLANTGDFIMPRFNEICDTIIRHKDHRDRLVKNTVVTLVPNLAEFSPFSFVGGGYLDVTLKHLLQLVTKVETRASTLKIQKLKCSKLCHCTSCNYRKNDYFDLVSLLMSFIES